MGNVDKEFMFHAYKPALFEGDKDEWYKWSQKFLAGARIKKYAKVMVEKDKIDMEVEMAKEGVDLTNEVEALIESDHQLKYNLMISMEQSVNFNLIVSAETGQIVWLELKGK